MILGRVIPEYQQSSDKNTLINSIEKSGQQQRILSFNTVELIFPQNP